MFYSTSDSIQILELAGQNFKTVALVSILRALMHSMQKLKEGVSREMEMLR